MRKIIYLASVVGALALTTQAAGAQQVQVTIESLAPSSGVYFTPVWVGFHNGSFDSYNGGLPSQPGLEFLAEDGNTAQITSDFANNLTYIDNSSVTPISVTLPSASAGLPQTGTRVQGTLGAAPIAPGGSVSAIFDISLNESNRYFSYASMILPSNDYYIANGNPFAHDISSLFANANGSISFNIGLPGTVNDAGTEVNDFSTSAGNVLFPGLPPGQTAPEQGANENGVNANVSNPFANFLNRPANFDTIFASLNFNDATLYPNGIARVTISRVATVSESSPVGGLLALGLLGLFALVKRKNES